MAMATAPTPSLVKNIVPTICYLKGPLALPIDPAVKSDLTIYRRTDTHHGGTLRILGHAAEYLVESRMLLTSTSKADAERLFIF